MNLDSIWCNMYMLPLLLLLCQVCWGSTEPDISHPAGRTDLFELSIIHWNDFHARFEQTSPTSGPCHKDQEERCVGGIARVYTAVTKLMNERPNPIFLNAGDNFQGTIWYNLHRWNVTALFMNKLPHDALTIGNHEFDHKIEGIVPFLRYVKAPIVVTNIDDSEEPSMQHLYEKSTIIKRGGKRIGIIGVILSSTNMIANTGKLKFLNEVESVNAEAQRLQEKGVDIIIVLSHCGLNVDRVMAANCPLVDVIVGGHSHTLLYTGTPPLDLAVDKYPVVVTQKETERTVLIVQAAAYTKYLGNLTVWFDEQGEVVDWDGNPILLDRSIEEDAEILRALAPWKKEVDAVAHRKIGSSKVLLDSRCRNRECNLGNFITDAMVDAYVDAIDDERYWTYAAVACTNAGGIRNDIERTEITYGSLIMVQPFENTWDTLELTGKTIRKILVTGGTLVWSGLKITYSMCDGERTVENVKIRCQACEYPVFENMMDNQWYRVVVPSYLVTGGDNFILFKNSSCNHKVGLLDMDYLEKYVKKMSPIIAGTDRRMIIQKSRNF
ncbi:apyrase isoform X2 [Odontomachus brunneus]|uniref:apyrase isoform X2 n=1 Tax=Odontomachus brunneus TaxID=486640 RepID=UPI0013F1DC1C|nr:apyrase isoform X2 [Odontomachus brunneus]